MKCNVRTNFFIKNMSRKPHLFYPKDLPPIRIFKGNISWLMSQQKEKDLILFALGLRTSNTRRPQLDSLDLPPFTFSIYSGP